MKIEGKVSFQDIEGGFWGIVSSNGQKYLPVEALPERVRIDGLDVAAEVEHVSMLGAAMWGQPVRVDSISASG